MTTLLKILAGVMILIACCARSQASPDLNWSVTAATPNSSNLVLSILVIPPSGDPSPTWAVTNAVLTSSNLVLTIVVDLPPTNTASYTISSSAATGGGINPSGSVTVNAGANQTFTATPDANYVVSQWLEDGNVVQTSGYNFTISNVETNHTVQVMFSQQEGAFTPVAGYWAWWNPDSGVTVNGESRDNGITNWVDQSPNAIALSQLGALDTEPELDPAVQNGHSMIYMDGSMQMTNFLYNLPQPCEIFLVDKDDYIHGGSSYIFGTGTANGGINQLGLGDNISGGSNTWLILDVNVNTDIAQNFLGGDRLTSTMYEVTYAVDGSDTAVYENGALAYSAPFCSPYQQMTGLDLGAIELNTFNFGWVGYVGDIIVYTNILSTNDQQTVENGLRAKYGF